MFCFDMLAGLYFQAGRVPEAASAEQQAVELAHAAGNAALEAELRARLARFEITK